MHQSPLLSLSLELILLICDELDLDDLEDLRLTCKFLGEGLAPLLLRHITISERGATTRLELLSNLQFLSQPDSSFARCTREITISGLQIFDVQIMDEEGQMGDAILKAIISLKTVHTVCWYTGMLDEDSDTGLLQETIWKAIVGLGPNLLSLEIGADSLQVDLNDIELLPKLESITFSSMPFCESSVVSAISKLYFSCATLKSMTIRKPFSIPCLLSTPSYLMPLGPPSLRHLDFTNCSIPFDEPAALSRLCNLSSFTYSVFPNRPDLKYSPEKMWMALQASEIKLEELDLGEGTVTASLVDYLSSFSGLKKLRLSLISSTPPPGTAARFWSAALPNHVDTLEDFVVFAADEGEWCFSRDNRSSIVPCTRLKFLGLSILCRRESLGIQTLDSQSQFSIDIKSMIDMTADLPCLDHLNLQVAGPVGPIEGILRWRYDEMMICDWLPTYEPPTSCGRLPWVSVGDFPGRFNQFFKLFGPRNCDMKLAYEEVEVDEDSDEDSE